MASKASIPTRRVSPCPFRLREMRTPRLQPRRPPVVPSALLPSFGQVILGANTLQKWRIKLDLENDRVIIDKQIGKMRDKSIFHL